MRQKQEQNQKYANTFVDAKKLLIFVSFYFYFLINLIELKFDLFC